MPLDIIFICEKCKREERKWFAFDMEADERVYTPWAVLQTDIHKRIYCYDCMKFVFADDPYLPAPAREWLFDKSTKCAPMLAEPRK